MAVGYPDVHAPRPQALQPRRRHKANAGGAGTLGALPAQDQLARLLVIIGTRMEPFIGNTAALAGSPAGHGHA